MKATRRSAALITVITIAISLAGSSALALTSDEKQVLTEIRSNISGGSRLAAAFEQSTISGEEPTIFPLEVENRGLLVWKIDEAYAEAFAQEIGLQPPFELASIRPLTVRGSQTDDAAFREWLESLGLDWLIDRLYPQHYYVIADIGVTQRAEVGAKLEFKTFVRLPGDETPRLYRFSSFKAVPGVELLQLSSNVPAALSVNAEAGSWSGELLTGEGSLSWSVPLRARANGRDSGRRFSEAFLDAGQTVYGPLGVSANYFYDGSSVSGGFLPDGFELAKIRFYPEQRRPVYAVSLNVYQSVGQNISGFRAEWSTYVINPAEDDPKPRFSILEAQTNIGGFDAVGALERYTPDLDLTSPQGLQQLIEPPSDVFEFVANQTDGIRLVVRDVEEQIEVDVSIDYPSADRILRTAPTTRWMEANDFVYWGEVADILKYDDNVMFAEMLVFDSAAGDLIRDTTFAEFVDPDPLPIILWNGPQKIALEPWGNLDGIETVD